MLLSSSKLFLDITNTSSYITLHVFLLLNVVLRGKRSILISNSFTLPPFLSEKTIYHLASRHLSFVTTLCFVHCCQRSRGSLGKTNLFPLFHSFSAAASSRKICGEQNATAMAEVRYNSSWCVAGELWQRASGSLCRDNETPRSFYNKSSHAWYFIFSCFPPFSQ